MLAKKEDIIVLPHANLRQRSVAIGYVGEDVKKLILDMQSAVLDWENSRDHELGVALAAIQINQAYRVVVIRDNFDDKNNKKFTILINPQITKYEGVIEEDYEGCLSIADVYGKVPRHTKVRVKALDIKGQEFRLTAEGFLARIFQHEIDHTNGIVFIDHIKNNPEAFYNLTSSGNLEKLDFETKVKNNKSLWEWI